jgi:hypothetical protein
VYPAASGHFATVGNQGNTQLYEFAAVRREAVTGKLTASAPDFALPGQTSTHIINEWH